jgi:hypothetical protein
MMPCSFFIRDGYFLCKDLTLGLVQRLRQNFFVSASQQGAVAGIVRGFDP